MPAEFRSWAEYEDKADSVHAWMPGIVHGLLQAEGYACALLKTSPGASDEAVKNRLAARMERQRRVLMRDSPPLVWFVVRDRRPGPEYGHLALQANGKAAVDGAHKAGVANGGSDDGLPGRRPQYGRRYYAAYLRDPDGLRLEVVSRR